MPALITEYKNENSGDFNPEESALLILSDTRYFIYVIIPPEKDFYLLREYKQEEEEQFTDFHRLVMDRDPHLQVAYREVHVGVANKRLVLVPDKIFDDGEARQYLENSAPLWSSDEIYTDHITSQHIKLVYAFRKSIHNRYLAAFPNLTLHNVLTQYINALDELNRHNSGYKVFVNALYNSLCIVLYRNDELTFANVYEFNTAEDFLYYVLLVYKEFQLDQETIPTYISGKLDADSIIHDLLYRYIRELKFINELSPDVQSIHGIPPHLYFDLFSIRA